jgi:predicted glycosyltransferase
MTHQVMIKGPKNFKLPEQILYRLHKWFICHYDECWIPDLPEDQNLSGDLSHKFEPPENSSYVGLLSRFETASNQESIPGSSDTPDLLAMISGPEPQRTLFEELLLDQLSKVGNINAIVLQGLPGKLNSSSPFPGVKLINHLQDQPLRDLVSRAGKIICRPGYSTLMDLVTLGKTAILVPTPGQTEQEYLATYLSDKDYFTTMRQDNFKLDQALSESKKTVKQFNLLNNRQLLEERITRLLDNYDTFTSDR